MNNRKWKQNCLVSVIGEGRWDEKPDGTRQLSAYNWVFKNCMEQNIQYEKMISVQVIIGGFFAKEFKRNCSRIDYEYLWGEISSEWYRAC